MRIIPTIEIVEGKCVSLTNNAFSLKKIFNENPIEVAKEFEGAGMQYLHLVDIDGEKAKHIVNYKILEQITSKTNLKIDFSGGLESDEDLHIVFNSGAKQIIGNSLAAVNPKIFERWLSKYGATKIILGTDYNNKVIGDNDRQESKSIIPYIKSYENKGIKYVVCNNLSEEGIIKKPLFEFYKSILKESKDIKLIASGGIITLENINQLEDLGCEGVIIDEALYQGKIRLKDLETYS